MIRIPLTACLTLALAAGHAGAAPDGSLLEAAHAAVADDAAAAESAIARLRDAGQDGLNALFEAHAEALASRAKFIFLGAPNEGWHRLAHAIDSVGRQHDCHASRLYWHTDLEKAVRAARDSGKPILSLRLLGNLDEECSCANSRFFRTALYANAEVSAAMRERFVLHWQSVRPVPKVTIDFGDGRKLERTLTGNSIHYVLDSDGRPVDAIPGLYGPKAFLARIERSHTLARVVSAAQESQRPGVLAASHESMLADLKREWAEDLTKAGLGTDTNTVPTNGGTPAAQTAQAADPPTAQAAAVRAVGKSVIEMPLLFASHTKPGFTGDGEELTDAEWERIAALHAEAAALDAGSIALMRHHHPEAYRAGRLAITKAIVEDPILRMVAGFQRSIALDTVRNEYLLHRQIHEWFAAGESATSDLDALNARVYAELFLTPDSDPWLGLSPGDAYTGLREGGVVNPAESGSP